jgi:hypothetical protein
MSDIEQIYEHIAKVNNAVQTVAQAVSVLGLQICVLQTLTKRMAVDYPDIDRLVYDVETDLENNSTTLLFSTVPDHQIEEYRKLLASELQILKQAQTDRKKS